MLKENKIFFAIIIGAAIIGGFIYLGIKDNNQNSSPVQTEVGAMSDIAPTSTAGSESMQSTSHATPANAGLSQNIGSVTCGAADNTIVTKVIDGDTVVVEGGWHVRLLGMDADETGYPCYLPAKTRLENLVLGKQVLLEKDKTDLDQYGRCLRYIFLPPTNFDSKTTGQGSNSSLKLVGGEANTNVDVELVKEGLAVARFYQPDIKYRIEISSAESYAQKNKVGCKWSGI